MSNLKQKISLLEGKGEVQHQGMDGPVDVIIAPRCRGICRGTPMTPGRHGF